MEKDDFLSITQPTITFDQVGGLEKPIKYMKIQCKYLENYIQNGYNFDLNGKILFSGPPGTGKTLLAEATAGQLKWDLLELQSSKITSSYMGETQNRLDETFQTILTKGKKAKAAGKGVVFFVDEIDFISTNREYEDVGEAKRNTISFLVNVEKLMFSKTGVLTIAATNHGHRLDTAAWSRFDVVLDFPVPSERERADIIRILLNKYKSVEENGVELKGIELKFKPNVEKFVADLAKKTNNFTGRNLRALLQDIVKEFIIGARPILDVEQIDQTTNFRLTPEGSFEAPMQDVETRNQSPKRVFHNEFNYESYADEIKPFLKRKGTLEALLELTTALAKLSPGDRELAKEVDFFFLQAKNPANYLKKLARQAEEL